jgi:hypothetical protein
MVITHAIQAQIRSPGKTWLSWCRPATLSASLAIKNVPSFVRHFAPVRPTPHHPIHHSLARFTPSCLLQSSANFARSFACSLTPNYPNPEFESAVYIESRNQLFGPPPRQANRYLHRVATWIPLTCISHCQRKALRTVKTGQRRGSLGLPARAIDVCFRQGVCIKGQQGTYRHCKDSVNTRRTRWYNNQADIRPADHLPRDRARDSRTKTSRGENTKEG